MTHKFAEEEAFVLEMVREEGFAATLIRAGELIDDSVYPPQYGEDTTFLFQAIQDAFSRRDFDYGLARSSSIKLLLATGATEPKVTDSILVSGKRLNIVNVMSVAPAGVPILWEIVASQEQTQ